MASTHKHIRSSTANKRPTTAIADGQVALNTNASSPGLFFKDSTGASIIKIGPVHVGSTAPNASPAAGGSAGNSTGEVWLDNSLSPVGVKIWDGSAWVNATPAGSTTVQGLLELATNAETQAGSDTARAVTSAGLQSKVSDSTSTTSSTTIASSTAVKAAYDLAAAALPLSGGTITGNLEIGTTGSLSFEGSTADAFETTIAVTNPTADRTITLPDTTGTVVTTGDTGTVTSTMILDGTIVNGDINASAAIAHSKLANITAGQVLLGNASNVPTATALSGDVTVNSSGVTAISSGVIVNADVNASAAIAGTKISPDFGSQTITTTGVVSAALGAAATPSITFTGDLNTGIYSPGADQVAISTGGSGNVFFRNGRIGVGESNPSGLIEWRSTNIGRLEADASTVTVNAASNAPLVFKQNDTERMRLTATGLGIGTTSPAAPLNVETSADGPQNLLYLRNTNSSGTNDTCKITLGLVGTAGTGTCGIWAGKDSDHSTAANVDTHLAFSTTLNDLESERARIDSSGRLLVGTSTAAGSGSTVQIRNDSNSATLELFRSSANNEAAAIRISKSRGSVASPAEVSSGDPLGYVAFCGYDGSAYVDAAYIYAEADGTWTDGGDTTDNPSRLVFSTTADGASSPTERARFTSSGDLCLGSTPPSSNGRLTLNVAAAGNNAIAVRNTASTADHWTLFIGTNATTGGWNGASTINYCSRDTGTGRSINAAGTINASGADYAEYMVKAGDFDIAKGAVCGVTADGLLTLDYGDAVSFVVKSTNPSYVGGDTWGTEDAIGVKPAADDVDALSQWEADLEAARQQVDRIAFAGQVPVNVMGATPGQYIVPIEAPGGGIEGIAKNEADLTLAEYMRAVGKVIAIEDDGRARIIVKVA